jgi:hypothetical protein
MTHDHTQDQPLETLSPEMQYEIYRRLDKLIDSARAVKTDERVWLQRHLDYSKDKRTFWQKLIRKPIDAKGFPVTICGHVYNSRQELERRLSELNKLEVNHE